MRAIVLAAALMMASAWPAAAHPLFVFFDAGAAELTAEGRSVVAEAIEAYRESQATKIVVEGHTDSLEAAEADPNLSLKRAEAVKQELIRLGMNADAIVVMGLADRFPIVPTPRPQAEPQNRRAVLDLQDDGIEYDPKYPPPVG